VAHSQQDLPFRRSVPAVSTVRLAMASNW
jgi:hypothetical protein